MHHRSLLPVSSLLLSLFLALPAGATQPVPRRADVERAIAAQRQLLTTHGDDALAWNDLGNLLGLYGDSAGSEAAYQRSLELEPNLVSAHYNLGLLLQSEGRRQEALEQFEKAVALDGKNAWSYYEIGRIHEHQGQRSAALNAYAQAFAIDPRLSLPDVNPHVIDNSLLTQALMKAATVEVKEDFAPRTYEDAARIARLLVATRPATGAPAQEGAAPGDDESSLGAASSSSETPPAATPSPEASTPPGASPPAREPAGEPESTPVKKQTPPPTIQLTPESLATGEVGNQASPAAGSPGVTGGTRSRTVPTPRTPTRSVRPGTPPSRTPAPSTPSAQRPTSPRPRFVPGARSSAQLERRLRPATTAP